jgi:MinD-like ATPase involved in chromosome partitioning or flagellar assembly
VTVAVLCALRGTRETAVVTALEGAAGRVAVTRRCADLAELLGAAEAGVGRLAVVSDDLPMLDREAVSRLRELGVRVVALVDGGDAGAARMHALGVHAVVDAAAPVGDVVTAVLTLADATDDDAGPGEVRRARLGTAGARTAHADAATGASGTRGTERSEESDDADEADGAEPVRGRLVAVWGPTGAPGRTTVAVNLAAELAALPAGPVAAVRGALLVDADTYGGTVAQVVGLLDEAPGIAAAARAAGQGTLDAAALARLTPVVAPDLRVLTGISRADRWPELPGSSLDVVWEAARGLAGWVVVDCGFCLEQDEALSYDTHAPRRNAATLSALEAADVVVVVGGADAVGIQRLVRGLGELGESGAAAVAERVVVVNRVRASAAGRHPERAVTEALARYAGVVDPRLVPDDRDAVDGALLQGATLREAAPGSPVRTAIAQLAADLAKVPSPGAGGRTWRRARSAARA